MFKWQLIFTFLFLIGMNGCTESGPTITVKKVEVRKIEFPPGPGIYPFSRVNRPYFDERNQLQWNSDQKNSRICGASSQFECHHEVILLKPRVDYCCCPNNLCTTETLIGLDDKEEMVWQRDLKRYDEDVIGVTLQTIVLGTLEVIDPKTGTIIEPFIINSNGRKRPKYSFSRLSNPTVFRLKTKNFVLFDAEYFLFSTQGGLYLFSSKQEVKELVKKGKRSLLRHLQIRNIALSEDERFAFLAQMWETRGPPHVEFAIFDLEKKRTVFKERLENDCSCSEPIIVVGKQGHVAMSYRNQSKRKHIIVHYIILP
ncbi:MAG: hypothetical protein DRR16_20955 [Candidatus Parabeggiatoa sp. nov. 3]|nr:MAG: hypothetical protein DRR00_28520 [Gammaproteobacteria bacterium]RKZ57460.1 MAG: hypothetical protein DRQ99_26930 [Gammaproteobacteria bacterium]RKZ81924.1 MAG: hypothetical protein DRR16_20955 [Gammaproteobacteria bacterium]